jgi:hypothetical protein
MTSGASVAISGLKKNGGTSIKYWKRSAATTVVPPFAAVAALLEHSSNCDEIGVASF